MMTDSNFPLQLWDCLTPQVESKLNMLCPICVNPAISAYEVVHGPYDWNCFPTAPLGCKAVIYEPPEAQSSWGSRGTNTWCTGPSFNHYCCNRYFFSEIHTYRISGLAKIFPQHCQVPFFMEQTPPRGLQGAHYKVTQITCCKRIGSLTGYQQKNQE